MSKSQTTRKTSLIKLMRRIPSTVSGSILIRIYFMVASLLVTLCLSRILGLAEFGRFSWLVSMVFLIAGLAQAGGNNLVVRETSKVNDQKAIIKILLSAMTFSSALLPIVATVLLFSFNVELELSHYFLLILMALLHQLLVLIGAATRGIGLIQKGQIPELVLRPTFFLILIAALTLTSTALRAEEIISAMVVAFLLSIAVAVYILKKALKELPVDTHYKMTSGWMKSFLRLGAISWVTVANAQLFTILTGTLADHSEVAIFRIAVQGALIIGLGFSALETVQAPALSRACKETNHRGIHDLIQQSCKIGLATSLPTFLFLLVAGRPLLIVLFGQEYGAAYIPLMILSGAYLINATTGNIRMLLIAAHQESKLLFSSLAAIPLSLVLAWTFIPSYGAVATAGAVGIGMITRNVLIFFTCWHTLRIIGLPRARYSPHTIK